jgi:hypothetical protein
VVTNPQSRTDVHEIADGIFRINTPIDIPGDPGGFNFNQYLIRDEQPLLFHTRPRRLFPLVREAVAVVMPVARAPRGHAAADACVHARQRVARGWRGVVAGAGEAAGVALSSGERGRSAACPLE